MPVFTVSIELTDEEFQIVGRATAGMAQYLADQGSPWPWDINMELIALLRRSIRDEGTAQQVRDNIASILRRGNEEPAAPIESAAWEVPDWLKALELGMDSEVRQIGGQ